MKRLLMASVLSLTGLIMTACAGGRAFVAYGPPPPRYGVIGVAPGPGYVWTEGFWDRRGGGWVWVGGHWMRPARPRAVWVAPEWRQEGRAWRFRRGYWR